MTDRREKYNETKKKKNKKRPTIKIYLPEPVIVTKETFTVLVWRSVRVEKIREPFDTEKNDSEATPVYARLVVVRLFCYMSK
jgi:hypothetical protein